MPKIIYRDEGVSWLNNFLQFKVNSKKLSFTDLLNTHASSISFWNGTHPVNSLVHGIILVDSELDRLNLIRIQSEIDGFDPDKLHIIPCKSSMPDYFWDLLRKIIVPFVDMGVFKPSGDEFTQFSPGQYWVSDFATIGKQFRSGIGSLIGSCGVATYVDHLTGIRNDIPHLGKVIVGDSVKLSNNVIISRAILGVTNIGNSTVIGTSSVIGHNVSIGNNCFIGPNVTICGSARIQDNVFIGAGSIITNACTIPSDSYVCAGAVVSKSYSTRVKLLGNPARPIPMLTTN